MPEPDPKSSTPVLAFDPEWLAITRAFHSYMSTSPQQPPFPDEATAREAVARELTWVRDKLLSTRENVVIQDMQSFVITAPAPDAEGKGPKQPRTSHVYTRGCLHCTHKDIAPHYANPQTQAFCTMLEIENKIDPAQAP